MSLQKSLRNFKATTTTIRGFPVESIELLVTEDEIFLFARLFSPEILKEGSPEDLILSAVYSEGPSGVLAVIEDFDMLDRVLSGGERAMWRFEDE